MNIISRKVGDYLDVTISEDRTVICLGFLSAEEAKTVREAVVAALDDLNWFIQTQEKN